MGYVADCAAMAGLCQQRAKSDPKNSGKWLARAERWRELADSETVWRSQKRPPASRARGSDGCSAKA
jgi:hypothetical protein